MNFNEGISLIEHSVRIANLGPILNDGAFATLRELVNAKNELDKLKTEKKE
jgi:hypothetical protein